MTPHTKAPHIRPDIVDVDLDNALRDMEKRARNLEHGRIALFVEKDCGMATFCDIKQVPTTSGDYASLMTKPPTRRG